MINTKILQSLILLSILIAAVHTQAKDISAEQDNLLFLITGLQANLEQATSGSGSMTLTSQGSYFAPDSKAPHQASVAFSFKGDKIRYDRTFSYDRNTRKEATDSRYTFQYIQYPDDDKDYAVPNAYIREKDFLAGSEFHGEVINLKRIMQPHALSLKQLIKVVEDGLAEVIIEEQPDGIFIARLLKKGEPDNEIQLWFDPEKGYNIIREKRLHQGLLLNDIERDFQNIDGIWMLRTLSWTRYAAEQNPDGQQAIDGKQYFEVKELNLNQQIPEETFNLRGFGLKPKTHIWDMIAGVDYTLEPMAAIEQQVSEILESLESAKINLPPIKQSNSTQEESKSISSLTQPKNSNDKNTAKATISNKQSKPSVCPKKTNSSIYFVAVLFIIVGVGAALLAKIRKSQQ